MLDLNWIIVKDWSENFRYMDNVTEIQARNLYVACTNRHNGILSWVKKRW